MKVIGFFFISLLMTSAIAMEKEAVVIEIRKKIKLHKTEIVYPDYFINGGTKLGLDKGSVVSVVRRVPVHDPFQNASIGDFRIKVAEVEIIHSDREKAIARLLQIDRTAERPMVKYDSVMVGDRLDLSTLRRKVAKVEPFLLPEVRFPASTEGKMMEKEVPSPPSSQKKLEKSKKVEPRLTKP